MSLGFARGRQRSRRWRGAPVRAVEPMVATILLVAITVVLAAVLYVLVSGLSYGTKTAPLGSTFSWGNPFNASGVPTADCGSPETTTFYCYTIEIAAACSGLTTSNLQLSLRNIVGGTIGWPGSVTSAGGSISLESTTSATPVATYSIASSSWTLLGGFAGSIGEGYSVVIYCGGHAEGGGEGLLDDLLVAVGTNGYSGTVQSNAFP